MRAFPIILCVALLMYSCAPKPAPWTGAKLTSPRDQLTVEHLHDQQVLPLLDMSFFAQPDWAQPATCRFSGAISFEDTEMVFPIARPYYPGENIFPGVTLSFISHEGALIPREKEIRVNSLPSQDAWNLLVGTGKVWHEPEDGDWFRASFPLSLTDSYIGQVKNCVATFLYKKDTISMVYLQCSQETADYNDHQVGDLRAVLPARYQPKRYEDSSSIINREQRLQAGRFPVYPLSTIDKEDAVAKYFEKSLHTNAPTSLGAVVLDEKVYLQPPETRHGLYPYPHDMRHAVYSVSKSMTGALALFYFAERYGAAIFDEQITDYVPALSGLAEWKGVTFSHTLNMVTGTEGGEDASRMYEIMVKARTAEETIQNIAGLGGRTGTPGAYFNYASTNLFVLSYALQNYVEQKEGPGTMYWDLVHQNVLVPLGAEDFTLLRTVEAADSTGIPLLAYGALPTLDNAAKIARLFANEGAYHGQQLLHKEKCKEALGRTAWPGYSTNHDYRGEFYRHSFWATHVRANGCDVPVTYMLGYGGNYVWLFPDNKIAIRFMDEYDLTFTQLVKSLEHIQPSCQ